ncbi:MAG: hypothetical protein JXB48_15355 [Candidatus Latescibacteria bacterium]|nr:hypothetical protein [Candidatus Latescibacterota bacterium]
MFTYLLRILLIWWLLTILLKWVGKYFKSPSERQSTPQQTNTQNDPDVVHSGSIEDADFEEMDQ